MTVQVLKSQIARPKFAEYFVLAKPGITAMVMVTAGIGYIMAMRFGFDAMRLAHALIGTALASAGASALNMVMERDLDAKMKRTENRPLPAGRLGLTEASVFGAVLVVFGVAYLTFASNPIAGGLAGLTVFTYLALYTPMKRHSSLCTIVGAVPGALPPLIGWTAATGRLAPEAWLLFAILFFWQLPHFLAIAWLYREDYARAELPMLTVVDREGVSAGRQAVLQSLALLLVSLGPVGSGMAGMGYLFAALVLGLALFGFSVFFALRRTDLRARRLFVASLIYLPALLAILALGKI